MSIMKNTICFSPNNQKNRLTGERGYAILSKCVEQTASRVSTLTLWQSGLQAYRFNLHGFYEDTVRR